MQPQQHAIIWLLIAQTIRGYDLARSNLLIPCADSTYAKPYVNKVKYVTDESYALQQFQDQFGKHHRVTRLDKQHKLANVTEFDGVGIVLLSAKAGQFNNVYHFTNDYAIPLAHIFSTCTNLSAFRVALFVPSETQYYSRNLLECLAKRHNFMLLKTQAVHFRHVLELQIANGNAYEGRVHLELLPAVRQVYAGLRETVWRCWDVSARQRHVSSKLNVLILQRSVRQLDLPSPISAEITGRYNVSVINFGDLSFAQQLRTVANTDILLSVHGAGLHWVVYQPSHSHIIQVLPHYLCSWKVPLVFLVYAIYSDSSYSEACAEYTIKRPIDNSTYGYASLNLLKSVAVTDAVLGRQLSIAEQNFYRSWE
jgi:hypothetical protein